MWLITAKNTIPDSSLNKDVHLKEYTRFPHGLWSLATSYGIEECKYSVSDAAAWVKELVAKHEKEIEGELGKIASHGLLKDYPRVEI